MTDEPKEELEELPVVEELKELEELPVERAPRTLGDFQVDCPEGFLLAKIPGPLGRKLGNLDHMD